MNEFEILLSGLLDEQKTLSNIETGITNLQSKLKGKINIEINIGDISQQINDVSNQIKSIGKGSKGVGLDDDPLASYKESLKETLHQYKMGTVDLETYVKKMQSLIFDNGSTYSENFLSIEDNKQEKYVRELTKAYEEQRKALDEVAKTKKNLNTIPTENTNNQNADPFLQYRSSLQKTIHEVRMGTTDLETYIKKLQSLIYNDDATYKAEFLNLTDAQQEKYVQALTSAYAEQQRALDEVTRTRQKNYTELLRESDAQSKNSTDQAIAIDKLRTSISEMNKAYGSFVNQSKANSLLAQIKDLEKMNPATVQYRNNLKLIQNETKKLGVESRNAFRQAQDAISDTTAKTGSLGLAFRTLGQFFMIGSPIMVISKTFKELVSTVNEANKSLTDIQMVTGMSTEEANNLAITYNELGQQIGATTQEILTGSVEWFRAGKTIQETEELIQASIVGSKMAGIETAQMTEYLTSALNGYQLEASEAMNVIDKMVAIDNNASTSLSELATAMSYTANIARATGLDMDSLLGNIGAVSEATRQSAETIGKLLPICTEMCIKYTSNCWKP